MVSTRIPGKILPLLGLVFTALALLFISVNPPFEPQPSTSPLSSFISTNARVIPRGSILCRPRAMVAGRREMVEGLRFRKLDRNLRASSEDSSNMNDMLASAVTEGLVAPEDTNRELTLDEKLAAEVKRQGEQKETRAKEGGGWKGRKNVEFLSRRVRSPAKTWYFDLRVNRRGMFLKIREVKNKTFGVEPTPTDVKPVILFPATRIRNLRSVLMTMKSEGSKLQEEYYDTYPAAKRISSLLASYKDVPDDRKKAIDIEVEELKNHPSLAEKKLERVLSETIALREKIFFFDLMRRPTGLQFLRIREAFNAVGVDSNNVTEGTGSDGKDGKTSEMNKNSVILAFGKITDALDIIDEMIPVYDEKSKSSQSFVNMDREKKASDEERLVYLANLPWEWDQKMLEKILAEVVPAEKLNRQILLMQNGKTLGCALVETEDKESASKLISELNGAIKSSRQIRARLDLRYNQARQKEADAMKNFDAKEVGKGKSKPPRWEWNRNKCVFVRNLSYDTKWQSLKDHMKQDGKFSVVRAEVFYGKDGVAKGLGRVEFENEDMVKDVIESLNDSELDGRRIRCQLDSPTPVETSAEPVTTQAS
ncbi:hypothetical protein AAMO2058_001622200 [Amorphochlora amoebiformis]